MIGARRRALWVAAGLPLLGVGACNSAPTQVGQPSLEVVIASGDGQFGVVGETLDAPLRVLVQTIADGLPRKDVSVVWEVLQGSASVLGVTTTLTDSTGSTEASIRLGASVGEVRVRATASEQAGASATFTIFAVNRPSLSGITPPDAAAGDIVTLTGTDFSIAADQNVVLFSGIRGRVLAATATTMDVEVPPCLPARDVHVRVQLGAIPGEPELPLTVTAAGEVTAMQVGEVIDVTDVGGLSCFLLPGSGGRQYLATAYSASSLAAAAHPYQLTVLSSKGLPASPAGAGVASSPSAAADAQASWDEQLRGWENDLVRSGGFRSRASGPARVGPAAAGVPAVGDVRVFQVLNTSGGFDEVSAVAEYVGEAAAVFVDEDAPDGGFTSANLEELAARFDDVIHPTVTSAFGSPSDLDENKRVIILFTPAVNRLTPRGASGFIGGFFYGVDLLPEATGSNGGEVFYALVPDPAGVFSDPRQTQEIMRAVPAVLAHEFQHMVHFNERVLVRGASRQEALWLSEGLAQMAEELVARAYVDLGDVKSGELFRDGAQQRALRYLERPDTVSLVVGVGQGSLAERGAGFLHLLYLADQAGTDILGRLTRTTLTGVTNVETQTGRSWPGLIADWWAAIYLDGPGPESGPLTYPTLDLRAFLGSFPLSPLQVGPGDDQDIGVLPSSSVRYYLVTPSLSGTVTVRLGGEEGGPSAAQSELRLRIIRIS